MTTAVIFESFGASDVLKLVTNFPKPVPADDEVLVKVAFAGVNPVDWKIRLGHLQTLMPHVFPIVPGWDASGVVESVGKDVKNFQAGDKVYSYTRADKVQNGTYGEYVAVKAAIVAKVPTSLNLDAAATIPLAGLTAWQSLFDFAKLTAGQTVLIHAGAGGVGYLAIQFAKNVGAKTIYTTASLKNHPELKALGADVTIDYSKDDFVKVIQEKESDGSVDVVFDAAGGEALNKSYEIVKMKTGVLVSIVSHQIDQAALAKREARGGFWFVSPNAQQLDQIAGLIDSGKLKPSPLTVLPLSQAKEAHDGNQFGTIKGKIVLKI